MTFKDLLKTAFGSTWHHYAKMAVYTAAAHLLGWLSINISNGTIHVKWIPVLFTMTVISTVLSWVNAKLKQEKDKGGG